MDGPTSLGDLPEKKKKKRKEEKDDSNIVKWKEQNEVRYYVPAVFRGVAL